MKKSFQVRIYFQFSFRFCSKCVHQSFCDNLIQLFSLWYKASPVLMQWHDIKIYQWFSIREGLINGDRWFIFSTHVNNFFKNNINKVCNRFIIHQIKLSIKVQTFFYSIYFAKCSFYVASKQNSFIDRCGLQKHFASSMMQFHWLKNFLNRKSRHKLTTCRY